MGEETILNTLCNILNKDKVFRDKSQANIKLYNWVNILNKASSTKKKSSAIARIFVHRQ
jgi:hypothetical protein